MNNMEPISEKLFAKIRGRFESVTIGDEQGAVTDEPRLAKYFDFDYKEGANVLGKVSITLDEKSGVTVLFNQDFMAEADEAEKNNWYNFLKELRIFSKKHMLNFDTRDITKSNLDKRDYAHLTKTAGETQMSESKMYGTSRTSFEDIDTARLVLKHTKPVNQEVPGSRTQNVHSMYIESEAGERFKYPFRHLNGARAMARHVAEGGNQYDDFGKHIVEMSTELNKLRKFKTYMNRSSVMAEGLKGYMEAVDLRLENIKTEVMKLQRSTYYKEAFENFTPVVNENVPEDVAENWIDQLTIRTFNEELKDVFPYVYKLVSEVTTASETTPEDLLGEEEISDEMRGQINQWIKKYSKYEGGYGTMPEGYVKWALDSGIATDFMEENEAEAMEEKYGEDFDNDPFALKFYNQMPITKACMEDLEKITGDGYSDHNARIVDAVMNGEDDFDEEVQTPEMEFERALDSIVGEEDNALIDGDEEAQAAAVKQINGLMAQHFPAGINGTNAIESMKGVIDDPMLLDMFKKVGQKDADTCVRPLVMKYLKGKNPDIMNKIDTGDLASESDDDNVPSKKAGDPTTDFTKWLKKNHNKGPRDLTGDEYTKHSKAFQAQKKAKEADDTMDVKIGPDGSIQKADLAEPEDTRSAGEKLEELVKSYYDYTTNNFPKGEQAVVTACEKEFGEDSVPVAEKMIARLMQGKDSEMERIKSLAGINN